ncbi:hypothetical protein K450DRAFT_263517 [Umbelopsis ramanniana AG]|uniref:Uncharacterized protein n=1 Tax=Umbelopsis ramanniana AG TaxID=1314678 RepID=A0AAD5HAE0_UMBRA|nr:uncharacterized protein K450DRAFT_263517 [Umbelopsis ramanniana AG]KAI8575058.1 hypothetical protein K450DRAFT_263517 [Umbelopsis ramanniana AG]
MARRSIETLFAFNPIFFCMNLKAVVKTGLQFRHWTHRSTLLSHSCYFCAAGLVMLSCDLNAFQLKSRVFMSF